MQRHPRDCAFVTTQHNFARLRRGRRCTVPPLTIRAQGSITTSLSIEEARTLVEANLATAGITTDISHEGAVTGSAGKLLKYRVLGIWLSHADELPISVEVEFASADNGTLVTAEVSDRQGVGLKLNLDPDKYEAAGKAAIASAFAGLTGVLS